MPIRKNLSLDMDGVLCNPVPQIIEMVNEQYGVLYCELDIKKFEQSLTVPRSKLFSFLGNKKINLGPLFRKYTADYDFVMSLEPIKDCRDYLWFLTDLWNINIHTARNKKSLPYLKEWLLVNDIPYNNIISNSSKEDGDVLVDDYDGNILKFPETKILFKQNWSINFSETYEKIRSGEIIVCKTWKEVFDQLMKIHGLWVG